MPPVRNHSNRPVTGILAIVSGLFLFSLQDVVIKHFSGEYSVLQIVVVRGLVAITFTAPIFVTVLSALLLGEAVGMRRWLAVLIGFAGVLLVIGPEGQIANIAVAFAGLAALTYALNSIIARYIGPEDKPWTVTLYFTLAHLLGGVAVSLAVALFGSQLEADHPSLAFLLRPWTIDDRAGLMLMIALGINAALGFYFLDKAYLSAPASTVAPFEYTYIIWAVLFGYLFWSEVPSANTVLGIILLISGNLYILHRQLCSTPGGAGSRSQPLPTHIPSRRWRIPDGYLSAGHSGASSVSVYLVHPYLFSDHLIA